LHDAVDVEHEEGSVPHDLCKEEPEAADDLQGGASVLNERPDLEHGTCDRSREAADRLHRTPPDLNPGAEDLHVGADDLHLASDRRHIGPYDLHIGPDHRHQRLPVERVGREADLGMPQMRSIASAVLLKSLSETTSGADIAIKPANEQPIRAGVDL
jgi:hypothetical protein